MNSNEGNTSREDAPFQRSMRGEISEDEYLRLEDEHLDRMAGLDVNFRNDALGLIAKYRREFVAEHWSFHGDEGYFDEGSLTSLISEVLDRSIEDADWLGLIGVHARDTEQLANTRPDGFVYVLEAGPFQKIGRTVDLPGRIKSLSIQLPFPVKCMTAFPCTNVSIAEAELHRRFGEYRKNGEWFTIPDFVSGAHTIGLAWLRNITYANTYRSRYLNSIETDFLDEIPLAVRKQDHWKSALAAASEVVEVEE